MPQTSEHQSTRPLLLAELQKAQILLAQTSSQDIWMWCEDRKALKGLIQGTTHNTFQAARRMTLSILLPCWESTQLSAMNINSPRLVALVVLLMSTHGSGAHSVGGLLGVYGCKPQSFPFWSASTTYFWALDWLLLNCTFNGPFWVFDRKMATCLFSEIIINLPFTNQGPSMAAQMSEFRRTSLDPVQPWGTPEAGVSLASPQLKQSAPALSVAEWEHVQLQAIKATAKFVYKQSSLVAMCYVIASVVAQYFSY